jgi:Resolvase, N terminal domain
MTPGDTLVVPSLDRLSRSLQDLITTVGDLRRRGVTSLHENLDWPWPPPQAEPYTCAPFGSPRARPKIAICL